MISWFKHIPRSEATAALVSLVVGGALMGIKFAAYLLTGSSSIFSDALESIVNVVTAVFAIYALSLAHRPADEEHPYGHGKIEFLSSGFEGGMILIAAIVIIVRAVEALVHGPQLHQLDLGLGLIGITAVVNGAVGAGLRRWGRRHGVITLEASGWHLMTDALSSFAVVGGLLVVRMTGWLWLDPVVAMGVAGYIIVISTGLLRSSAAGLMDQQDIDDDRLLRRILDSHLAPGGKPPHICSYHKLRHRHSGRYHWVDFHIMVPSTLDIDQGHRIASTIEYEIEQALGDGNATAHVEPCEEEGCGGCGESRKTETRNSNE